MSGERVLVVDDEPQIRRALRTALAGNGYDVETAADGAGALQAAATWRPDAIVLDLVMPPPDGLAVLRDLRGWTDVPVIVLSARGQEVDKVTALDLGADDYLTKPFGIGELLARLRAVLRRGQRETPAVVEVGPVAIDLVRHVVTRGGQEVHLTPTEFSLLRALAADVGKVLTHRQLLERAWGSYAADNTRQLRVYINYLRRKLEDDPERPRLILTEPGVGYRLRLPDDDLQPA
ncbi:MAG: response regulator [Chloroflexota bacterium]